MKDLLVLLACLPIAIALTLQISLNSLNQHDAVKVSKIVNAYAEEARFDGYFKDDDVDKMKKEIADTLNCEEDEVIVNCTEKREIKYKATTYSNNSKIEYSVEAPIKKVIAAGSLYGISDAANKGKIIKEGYVMSEKLR
jgi:hypothetical protein